MTDPYTPHREMELRDEYVPEELFSQFLEWMPQVCVELVVETDEGILLVKREENPPVWFWPGGRLYKGEQLEQAALRIGREELGLKVDVQDRCGTYTHFWEDSPVKGSPSRHTVNIVFHVVPADDEYEIKLDGHHSDYRFVRDCNEDLHEYVRLYLRESNLL